MFVSIPGIESVLSSALVCMCVTQCVRVLERERVCVWVCVCEYRKLQMVLWETVSCLYTVCEYEEIAIAFMCFSFFNWKDFTQ